MLVEIINRPIDSLYHCCFLIEVKEVSKQQIMCDYDDSLLPWGRLESHLGSSYDSNRLLLIMSWTARKRTTTFPPLPSLVFEETVRHFVKCFYTFLMKMALKGTAHPPACTSYFKQHFQPVVRFSSSYQPFREVRVQSGYHFSPSLTPPIWWGWSQVA